MLATDKLKKIKAIVDELNDEEDNKTETEKYLNDPVLFIDTEVKIFNPEKDPPVIPFTLFEYQKDFIRVIHKAYLEGKSVLDEKSRQMGLSWLYMAFFLWGVMFHPQFTGFVMSYKEALVDNGGSESTHDSLLGKIRFMYEHLNEKLKKSNPLSFKHLSIINKKNMSSYIKGESANVNAGRGGTFKIGLWDETASTPRSEQIFTSFLPACRSKFYNSTVRGRGNLFSRLRHDPKNDIQKHTLHWKMHPERITNLKLREDGKWTSDWYEAEIMKGFTSTQIAQELDIDYEASVEGRVFDKLNSLIHQKKLDFNPDYMDSTIICWDLGISDETFGLLIQKDYQGDYGIIDEVYGTDEEIRFFIDLLCGVEPKELQWYPLDRKKFFMDFLQRSRARRYKDIIQVLPHDARNRSITNKRSVEDQFLHAAEFGLDRETGRIINRAYQNLKVRMITNSNDLTRVSTVKKLVDPTRNRVMFNSDCMYIWERIMNYKWARNTEGENQQHPEHDWASHGSDCLGYGLEYFEQFKGTLPKPNMSGIPRRMRRGNNINL
jgi:hypothetical protein